MGLAVGSSSGRAALLMAVCLMAVCLMAVCLPMGLYQPLHTSRSVASRQVVKPGHYVSSSALSPDSGRLATGDENGHIEIHDVLSGRLVQTLDWPVTPHFEHAPVRVPVRYLAYSPNGQHLAALDYHNTLRLYDTATGALRWSQRGTDDMSGYSRLEFSPRGDTILTGGEGLETARLWNTATGQLLNSWMFPFDSVIVMVWNPSKPAWLHLPKRVRNPYAHWPGGFGYPPPGRLLFTAPNGKRVAVLREDETTVEVRSLPSFRLLRRWKDRSGYLSVGMNHQFSPDGRLLLLEGRNGAYHVWNASTGRLTKKIRSKRPVFGITVSPNDHWLAIAHENGSVNLWSLQ